MNELEELAQKFSAADESTELFGIVEKIRAVGDEGLQWIRDSLSEEWGSERRQALLYGLATPAVQSGWVYDLLLQDLHSSEKAVVSEAVSSLHFLQIHLAQQLLEKLEDPDEYVRARALEMIVGRTIEAHDALDRALDDPSFIVRETAVDLIDDHGLRGFEERLRAMVADPHEDVRQAVATALAHLQRDSASESSAPS